jgi:hypothetical protein
MLIMLFPHALLNLTSAERKVKPLIKSLKSEITCLKTALVRRSWPALGFLTASEFVVGIVAEAVADFDS